METCSAKLTCIFSEQHPWPDEGLFTLSYTTARRVSMCRWVFAKAKLLRTPEHQSSAAGRGRILHDNYRLFGLDAQANGIEQARERWAQHCAAALMATPLPAELVPVVEAGAAHFADNAEELLAGIDSPEEVNLIEQMFWLKVQLPDLVFILNGRIDRVRYHKPTQWLRLCDWKTPDQITKTERFLADIQGATYAIAAREWAKNEGLEVKGYQFRADFTSPKCACHYHIKEVTEAEMDKTLEHYIRVARQVAAIRAAWPGNDAPIERQWAAATPSPGAACTAYDEPCPFVGQCSAADAAHIPVIVTIEDAKRLLTDIAVKRAAASANSAALKAFTEQTGLTIYEGGLAAGVFAKDSIVPIDLDAIGRWLKQRGRPLSDALILNGKKKGVIEEMRNGLSPAERLELEAMVVDPKTDGLNREMARNRLEMNSVLLTTKRTLRFAVKGAGEKED